MEKKILNEINDMRVKMGLHILNENSILLTEGGVVNTFIDKFIVKTLITTAEKNLVKGFVEGTLSSADKVLFKDFLKRPAGNAFIKEFESAIAAESNPVIAKKAQAYLDNQIKRQIKSTVGGLPGKGGSSLGVETEVLKSNAQTIFNLVGIKMSTEQAKILNDASKKLLKLNPVEIIQVEQTLKEITGSNGLLQQARTRLVKAKDLSSEQNLANFDRLFSKAIGYLNVATKNVGKIKTKNLAYCALTLTAIAMLFGGYTWLRNSWLGQVLNLPEIKLPSASGSKTEKPESNQGDKLFDPNNP